MNQRGARTYLVRLTDSLPEKQTIALPVEAAAGLERGSRLLFYEQRGEGDQAKASIVARGIVDRMASLDADVTIHLREYSAFKRRVPVSELRTDPRRDPAALVQPVSEEIFNAVLSRARRS